MFDRHLLRYAGVTRKHLMILLNISGVTASKWLNGHTQPHDLIQDRVNRLLGVVKTLADEGRLPAPPGLGREERYVHTLNQIRTRLHETAPEPSV